MPDELPKSSHGQNFKRIRTNPFVFINSLAILVSLTALILLAIFPFAIWQTCGLLDDFVDLKLRFATSLWPFNSLKLLFFAFLLCFGMSLLLLLRSLGKVTFRFPSKRFGLLGLIPSFAALIFTLLLTIDFLRHPAYRPLRLSICFYSSLICALLLMFLFILQLTKEPIFRSSALITQIFY